jgi:hypothetical protein
MFARRVIVRFSGGVKEAILTDVPFLLGESHMRWVKPFLSVVRTFGNGMFSMPE